MADDRTCTRRELPNGEHAWDLDFLCPLIGCDYHAEDAERVGEDV